jgi:hypothetical protein
MPRSRQRAFSSRVIPYARSADGSLHFLLAFTQKYRDWTAFGGACYDSRARAASVARPKTAVPYGLVGCATREVYEETRGCVGQREFGAEVGQTLSAHPERVFTYLNPDLGKDEYLIFQDVGEIPLLRIVRCFEGSPRRGGVMGEVARVSFVDYPTFWSLLLEGLLGGPRRLDPGIARGIVETLGAGKPQRSAPRNIAAAGGEENLFRLAAQWERFLRSAGARNAAVAWSRDDLSRFVDGLRRRLD